MRAKIEKQIDEAYLEYSTKNPIYLRERIEVLDAIRALTELKSCLNDSEKLINFLKQRWDAIKETFLSYTASNRSLITKICCDVAIYLEQETNKPALSYLLPLVNYKTTEGSYIMRIS